jgi:hypothetical protein
MKWLESPISGSPGGTHSWDRYSANENDPSPQRRTPRPELWPDTGLHAAWLGHSTVLLKIDGVTIVTDPVFSTRVGLNFGPLTIGLKRLVEPALRVEADAASRPDPALARSHGSFRSAQPARRSNPKRPAW